MSRIILTDILGKKSTKLSSCASQIFYARIFYFHTKNFRLPFQFWHCFYRFRTDSDQLADVKIQDMQSLKGKKILSLKLFPLHCALFDEVSALHTSYSKASLSRFKQIKFILLNRNWVQQQQCTFCSNNNGFLFIERKQFSRCYRKIKLWVYCHHLNSKQMYPSIWCVAHIIPGDKLQENEKIKKLHQ